MNSPVGIISNNSNKNNSTENEPEEITEIINQERDHRTRIIGLVWAVYQMVESSEMLNELEHV